MSKLIIHNRTNLSDLEALLYVKEVVKDGKCSETGKGKQYCFVTTFKDSKIQVIADRIKDRETHTFYIVEG